MKNLQFLKGIAFGLSLIGCFFLTSCEKEDFTETESVAIKPTLSNNEAVNRNFNPCGELTDDECLFGLGAVLEELMGHNVSGTGGATSSIGKFENILNCYDVPTNGCDLQCEDVTITHAYGAPFPWFFSWTLPAENPCPIDGFTVLEQQNLLNQIKQYSFINAPECGTNGAKMYPVHYDVIWQLEFENNMPKYIYFGAIVDYVPCGGFGVGF